MASLTQSTGAGEEQTQTQNNPSTTSPSNKNIEMTDLEGSKSTGAGSQEAGLLNDVSIPTTTPITSTFSTSTPSADDKNTIPSTELVNAASSSTQEGPLSSTSAPTIQTSEDPITTTSKLPSIITRTETQAIGPDGTPTPTVPSQPGPVLIITLLLASGAKHPFKLDEKYLTKRAVTVPEKTASGRLDPYSISIYTLKELILREWRDEWETKPTNPSSIRLINFGRILEDNMVLKDCRFTPDAANVVHMTVRPQEFIEEEEARDKADRAREREGGESTAGCRCVIL